MCLYIIASMNKKKRHHVISSLLPSTLISWILHGGDVCSTFKKKPKVPWGPNPWFAPSLFDPWTSYNLVASLQIDLGVMLLILSLEAGNMAVSYSRSCDSSKMESYKVSTTTDDDRVPLYWTCLMKSIPSAKGDTCFADSPRHGPQALLEIAKRENTAGPAACEFSNRCI